MCQGLAKTIEILAVSSEEESDAVAKMANLRVSGPYNHLDDSWLISGI